MTKAYFFVNKQYLRHTIGTGADAGYPKDLSHWHTFLANGVDAAVNWGLVNSNPFKAYFFKGNEYLRWTIGKGADVGYPRPLTSWHPFLANGVDAAVNWGIVGGKPKVYFFKGNEYLRWTIGEGADAGYPRPLTNWHSFLANGVSAAVNWTGIPTVSVTDEGTVILLKRLLNEGKRFKVLFEGPDAAKIIETDVLKSHYGSSTAAPSTFAAGTGITLGGAAVIATVAATMVSAAFISAITIIFSIALLKGYRIDATWGTGRWNIGSASFDLPYIEFELIPPAS